MANDFIQKGIRHYENMQDSGVEWLGMIPKSWSCIPAGKLFQEVKEKNVGNQYRNAFSFRYGEIVDKKSVVSEDEHLGETLSNYHIVIPNDIVINGLNLNYDFITQRVAIVHDKGIITSAYLCVRSNSHILYPRFSMYLLKAFDFRQVFHSIGSGIRKTLKFQDFKKLPIIYPPYDCQVAIVDYLDRKIGALNKTIEEIRTNIIEYRSWKSSIIYETVTKGLDSSAEMKDSGFEWIGKIPVSSSAIRLKYIVDQIQSGTSVNAGQFSAKDEELGILKTSCVSKYFFNPNENKSINRDEYSRVTCSVKKGTIIVSRMNTPELVGACGYVTEDYPNLFLPDRLWQVSFKKGVNVRFVWYFLQSHPTRQYYASLATGTSSSMQNISQAQFLNAPIIMLSEAEQRKVVAFLDKKCELIEELIAEKSMLISDLESYKKSLIYEVVTGKRKVI